MVGHGEWVRPSCRARGCVLDSDANVIYLQLAEDQLPMMELTPEELEKVSDTLKKGSCDLLFKTLKEDYPELS
eukprot:911055-Pyramimonas_sp.AAC.2